jgi:diguanylate cyclase (GGDEF)-like protein/PAS domain S-box-containing protein
MMERNELLEAMLDSLPDGVVLQGPGGEPVCWNRAAEAITGYASMEVLGRPVLEPLLSLLGEEAAAQAEATQDAGRKAHMRLRHKLGHEVPLIGTYLVLRDGLGSRIGRAVLFHPARSMDALPHGDNGDDRAIAASQQELEDRLNQVFDDFSNGGEPFGVLWISVDQAHELRKTHGAAACETMLAKVQHVIAQGLRPAEEMGRWGTDEFLVIAHERSADLLSAHARRLAGLARTTDFLWWGDRVQLTVSIGACQARLSETDTLAALLKQAQRALQTSMHAGGNTITPPAGGTICLPS